MEETHPAAADPLAYIATHRAAWQQGARARGAMETEMMGQLLEAAASLQEMHRLVADKDPVAAEGLLATARDLIEACETFVE